MIVRHVKDCAGPPCSCPRHDPTKGEGAELLAEFKARAAAAADAVREAVALKRERPSERLTIEQLTMVIGSVHDSLVHIEHGTNYPDKGLPWARGQLRIVGDALLGLSREGAANPIVTELISERLTREEIAELRIEVARIEQNVTTITDAGGSVAITLPTPRQLTMLLSAAERDLSREEARPADGGEQRLRLDIVESAIGDTAWGSNLVAYLRAERERKGAG